MFGIKFVQKLKAHVLCSNNIFPPKTLAFMRKCGKILYSRMGYKWQYNEAHALCMVNNWGYRHTLRISNTYCFSTAI